MAVSDLAFEAPVNRRHNCPSQERPIDLVHLAGQTMGNKSLEIEVLQLFGGQARRALQEMTNEDTRGVVAAAHRLKGAALAIGAFIVADAAQRVEEQGPDAGRLAKVSAAVVDAENFILKLCR